MHALAVDMLQTLLVNNEQGGGKKTLTNACQLDGQDFTHESHAKVRQVRVAVLAFSRAIVIVCKPKHTC